MNNKLDLAHIFGVEDLITPKTILDDTIEVTGNKTPFVISNEVKQCIDMMNDAVRRADIAFVLKCLEGIVKRTAILQETALRIRKELGGT